MRSTKMLGIAAMATMAAMALVEASSAMAEPEHPEIVFCEKLELFCELDNWAPNPTEIHLETLQSEPPVLLSSFGNVECEHSLMTITLLNNLAKSMEGHFLALNFTGECHLGKTKCTVAVTELGGLWIRPGAEKLTAIFEFIELEGRDTIATVKCGFLIKCTYHPSLATRLVAHSDEEGHLLLLASDTPLKWKEGLCPEITDWSATYYAINLDAGLTSRLGLWIEL